MPLYIVIYFLNPTWSVYFFNHMYILIREIPTKKKKKLYKHKKNKISLVSDRTWTILEYESWGRGPSTIQDGLREATTDYPHYKQGELPSYDTLIMNSDW